MEITDIIDTAVEFVHDLPDPVVYAGAIGGLLIGTYLRFRYLEPRKYARKMAKLDREIRESEDKLILEHGMDPRFVMNQSAEREKTRLNTVWLNNEWVDLRK